MMPITAYTYKGENPQQHSTPNGGFSILNWNVCCFDGDLSMLFGGVLPWKKRIKKIAHFLIDQAADIVCLQEMFSYDASLQLYKLLKDRYAYFYFNIGLHLNGVNSADFRLPSGLFIASNHALGDAQFIPFAKTPEARAMVCLPLKC